MDGALGRMVPAFDSVVEMVRGVREMGMEACVTLGMLTEPQARRGALAACEQHPTARHNNGEERIQATVGQTGVGVLVAIFTRTQASPHVPHNIS